jgi:sorting nexin-29
VDKLQIIMEQVWITEEMPIEWEEGTICPIHKKRDQLECGNYRGITLLSTAYKIFSNILFERLEPYVNNILGNYQCGFRKGKSTVDQIHSLRQILEKTREYDISTFHLFIDFKAAYDSVKRDKLQWKSS